MVSKTILLEAIESVDLFMKSLGFTPYGVCRGYYSKSLKKSISFINACKLHDDRSYAHEMVISDNEMVIRISHWRNTNLPNKDRRSEESFAFPIDLWSNAAKTDRRRYASSLSSDCIKFIKRLY